MIDSHTHLFIAGYLALSKMAKAGYNGVIQCAFIPVRPTGSSTFKDLFDWIVYAEEDRCNKVGLRSCPAVGIHPRCVPLTEYKKCLSIVEEYLGLEKVKALGEVGLEEGSEKEVRLLVDQLKIAIKLDKPAIVHTPRRNKKAVTEKLISVLKDVGINEDRVVIDHINEEVFDIIRRERFYMGLTIQPGKLTVGRAIKLIEKLDKDRILINSDVGREDSDPLAIYKLFKRLASRKIVYDNPRKFFNLS